MKTTIRLATKDQYCFLETETDIPLDAEQTVQLYNELYDAYWKPRQGVETKEFNRVLDEYLVTGKVVDGTEAWAAMSEKQKFVFNEIKKSLARTTNKNDI